MKERKVIYKCSKFPFDYSMPLFNLFIFDNSTFAIECISDWLEGTREELKIEFIEDEDDDYSHYLLLGKFYVDFQDGIYITNWLNKHE
jgi:hypothetical protein